MKFFWITLFLTVCLNTPITAEIIPGASYAIVKKDGSLLKIVFENITGRRKLPYKTIFYTFDGNPIKEIPAIISPSDINKQLDPSAPKPQPITFKVIWHDMIMIWHGLQITGKYYIHFYDKNGNQIEWSIYKGSFPIHADDIKKYEIKDKKFIKQLDLSIVKNMTRPWTDQLMWDLFNSQLFQ